MVFSKMRISRPVFCLFLSFPLYTNQVEIDKSVDCVLEINVN